MSRSAFAVMALGCALALGVGSTSAALSGPAEGSCSRGQQPGDVATRPTTLQGPFLPLLRDQVAAHGEISLLSRSEDGTIKIGLHPEVTQADLCAVADLVFEEFGVPVDAEEKAVVPVSP
jgi:hypothetical protein